MVQDPLAVQAAGEAGWEATVPVRAPAAAASAPAAEKKCSINKEHPVLI